MVKGGSRKSDGVQGKQEAKPKRQKLDTVNTDETPLDYTAPLPPVLPPMLPSTSHLSHYQQNQSQSCYPTAFQTHVPPVQSVFQAVPTFPRQQFGSSTYLPYTPSPPQDGSGHHAPLHYFQPPRCYCGHQCPPLVYPLVGTDSKPAPSPELIA